MKAVYPKEYQVGMLGLILLRERFGADLPDDEAANIAFHLADAALDRSDPNTLQVVQLIAAITTIVSNAGRVDITGDDLHTRRLLLHLQFFAERFFSGRTLNSDTLDFLYRNMSESHPRAIATAERVRAFISAEHGSHISNEEVAYLAVHIARAVPG